MCSAAGGMPPSTLCTPITVENVVGMPDGDAARGHGQLQLTRCGMLVALLSRLASRRPCIAIGGPLQVQLPRMSYGIHSIHSLTLFHGAPCGHGHNAYADNPTLRLTSNVLYVSRVGFIYCILNELQQQTRDWPSRSAQTTVANASCAVD